MRCRRCLNNRRLQRNSENGSRQIRMINPLQDARHNPDIIECTRILPHCPFIFGTFTDVPKCTAVHACLHTLFKTSNIYNLNWMLSITCIISRILSFSLLHNCVNINSFANRASSCFLLSLHSLPFFLPERNSLTARAAISTGPILPALYGSSRCVPYG